VFTNWEFKFVCRRVWKVPFIAIAIWALFPLGCVGAESEAIDRAPATCVINGLTIILPEDPPKFPRTMHWIPGLYDAIDPSVSDFEGFRLEDRSVEQVIRTVVFPNGFKSKRSPTAAFLDLPRVTTEYFPETKNLVFTAAYLNPEVPISNKNLFVTPSWIDPPRIPVFSKHRVGIPTITYLRLRQMKMFGIKPGTLKSATISMIFNLETRVMLSLFLNKHGIRTRNDLKKITDKTWNQFLRKTPSFRSIEAILIQSGHQIVSVHPDFGTSHAIDLDQASVESIVERMPLGNVKSFEGLIKRGRMTEGDLIYQGDFNITIKLSKNLDAASGD
jgi:hypothetical protein